jgi:RNA polymerase sigma-70 factor, ECF subfamily
MKTASTLSLTARDEESLAVGARDGDHLAFGELYRRYHPIFTAYVTPRLPREDVADTVQAAFLNVLRGLPKYRGPRFFSWAYRICVNTATDELRRRQPGHPPPSPKTATHTAESSAPTPEEELIAKRLARHISGALDALPPGQRAVFVLARIDGLDYSEIASLLGVPLGTVKSRMFSALRALSDHGGSQ